MGPTLLIAALALACALADPGARAPRFDLLVRGGELVDGTGAPRRPADIGITGEAIAAIGDLSAASAARTIDATGLVVAPGFIDMHSHSDLPLLADGRALSKVTQGVTTELLGESGSAAPVTELTREAQRRSLEELGLELEWSTFAEYFALLESRGTSVNVLSTVGTGQLRASVVGYDDRPAVPEELAAMAELERNALDDGAVGLSSGLVYAPDSYASTDEIIALARVAARRGGIYLVHVRGEDSRLLDSLEEAIRIGREADLRVEVLHFKRLGIRLAGDRERPSIRDAVARIERAQHEGVRIAANMYPYTASQTTLGARIPNWAFAGGRDALLARIRDPDARARLRGEIRERLSRGIAGVTADTILFGSTPWEPHQRYLGMRIDAIARDMKVEPAEAILELMDRSDAAASAIYFGMRESDVRYVLALPWTDIGSDGVAIAPDGVLARSHPHPRWYGTFPRVLGHYVRELGVLSLEEAVRKMTSLPASRIGLSDRGRLAVGAKADVVVFDPDTIADRATFERPHQLSQGVKWLVVNGALVIADGSHTGATPGRVLRPLLPLD